MCGIVGYLGKRIDLINTEDLMRGIAHRGPDETGEYRSENVFLGHKRLSIVGLSDGQQPFIIDDYVIVFNGEIYNYQELKKIISEKGVVFNTNSDTEVLLKAYIHLGNNFVDYLDGMYAFFIYNKSKGEGVYARDNLGIKPLYIWGVNDEFAFSSEALPLIRLQKLLNPKEFCLSETALSHYLDHGHTSNIPITDQIKMVPKGVLFHFENGQTTKIKDIDFSYDIGRKDDLTIFKDEVKQQLHADVDVGIFLSGGIDSSLLTAIGASVRSNVKTFSITFDGQEGVDESEFSREVSNIFSTQHTEFVFDESTLLKYIPDLIKCMDLPVCDPAMLPMLHLCEQTKEEIKVVLSGDGGDELFGGYTHYRIIKYQKLFKAVYWVLGLVAFVSTFKKLRETINELNQYVEKHEFPDYDIYHNLDYRLLRKTDLTSMYYGLEVRVPLLSKRIFSLSKRKKYWDYVGFIYGKKPLRKLVKKLVNRKVAYKKKQGFRIPLKEWVTNGELGKVINDSLTKKLCIPEEIIDSYTLEKMLNNKLTYYNRLFSLYLMNEWLNRIEN
ncbi:MAG: asparagine synthase (glutamine-hydrolyzing) [Balneola sp.]|jgi:asparagine synthase (glutamine-hydrolysing)